MPAHASHSLGHGFAASYVGRFAPSPSGPLHAGSLVAALASYLDARAHGGRWLLRIEDIDQTRTEPGADRMIMQQLHALGLCWDEAPVWQTQRHTLYSDAFARLQAAGLVYPCNCHRNELPRGPYPGTCRPANRPLAQIGQQPDNNGPQHQHCGPSWRFMTTPGLEHFNDRWLGIQVQDVAREIGDFIVRRADGLWAYQLVVVVDDGLQGITDIVRGADLLDSTARQRQLARALDLPSPRVMHVPLMYDAAGHKLSKQNHAPALDLKQPLYCLQQAWLALGFGLQDLRQADTFLTQAIQAWARRFDIRQRGYP